MSAIMSGLSALLNYSNPALLADLEGAFSQIEALIGDIKNHNMALAISNLEQAAAYILKGLVEYEAGQAAPSAAPAAQA